MFKYLNDLSWINIPSVNQNLPGSFCKLLTQNLLSCRQHQSRDDQPMLVQLSCPVAGPNQYPQIDKCDPVHNKKKYIGTAQG